MDNLIEKLYDGTLDFSLVNFDFEHIEKRSVERKIPIHSIKNLIYNEKMLNYKKDLNDKNRYKLFYKNPKSKDFGKIVIGVKTFNDCINIMTVYEDKLTASKSGGRFSESSKKLNEEELEDKLLKNARHQW